MGLSNFICGSFVAAIMTFSAASVFASEFNQAWRNKNRALILDGYEFNQINIKQIATNKRVAAFIHKASDGLPAPYRCTGDKAVKSLCVEKWRRYSIARELYHTRRALAKKSGLKWGAYHLARSGNPLDQARHFLDYAEPTEDEAIVIDIEDNDPEKWMSLDDAEIFARYIYRRLGRWPMLYTNGSTAQYIANNREKYEILSRLPLWYARYKPDIGTHFPKGHWEKYDIWQFQAQINCSAKKCPYRVNGTNDDIDINVVDMTVEELHAAWPMDQLKEVIEPDSAEEPFMASLPAESSSKAEENIAASSSNDQKLYLAHRELAKARGAEVPPLNVDNTVTASTKPAPINDLY
ncbi:glycoside hydrolase family 25 protein [Ahrensia kielensis]|uniref:glycoside hydrolase family 25 protein n=1 Tax=Ahrensia kielensis TaxID=76980 RepID=UPI00037CD9AC|nr:glycoside hydrolase family 25 protein [Ahrensia kielensis]